MSLKKLIAEPLIHFVIISIAIFVVYEFTSSTNKVPQSVSISEARVEQLKGRFKKVWLREPSATEMNALKKDYLLDQIYALKARELGLDINDAVITKRLRQKAEFMFYGADKVTTPSEQELTAFYQVNRKQFTSANEYQLTYVSLNKDSPKAELSEFLLVNSTQLNQSTQAKTINYLAENELTDIFGESFVNAIKTSQLQAWLGPLESNSHLFYAKVMAINPGVLADFAKVKREVLTLYKEQKAQQLKEQHQQELLTKYQRSGV